MFAFGEMEAVDPVTAVMEALLAEVEWEAEEEVDEGDLPQYTDHHHDILVPLLHQMLEGVGMDIEHVHSQVQLVVSDLLEEVQYGLEEEEVEDRERQALPHYQELDGNELPGYSNHVRDLCSFVVDTIVEETETEELAWTEGLASVTAISSS